jgi:DNA-binding PucR family transcriptional regulator
VLAPHTHREALAAQLIARAVNRRTALTHYGEIELLAFAAHDPNAARALVSHQLGELAGRDCTTAVLRATARAYLQNGGNAAAAARSLQVHKNTVHYRLHRTEELLGRALRPGDIKLQLALELAHALGPDLAALDPE